MATISGASNEKVYSIAKWGGLNESPDGDTRLKLGEASVMRNWKITRDGNLKRRPGTQLVSDLCPSDQKKPIAGMWSGYVMGRQMFLAACDGMLWSLYDADNDIFEYIPVGSLNTENGVSFFPFGGNVYILNGEEYYQYDGSEFKPVEGYRPLIAMTIGPIDADTDDDDENDTATEAGELTAEYVNRLTGKRRVWISPDGENRVFQMPETDLASFDYVKNLSTGEDELGTCYGNIVTGKLTFFNTPPKAVNSYEIGYTAKTTFRSQVTANRFAELFSGTTDTRIFLYGDGSNKTLYSGMDYDGMPRADYFPDQYETQVGDSNTPITAMIRHYANLIAYKPNEAWVLQHGIVELATSDLTPAIYTQPVNRDIGNIAAGMVRLVDNNPVTAFGHQLYSWSNSSYYTSNLSRDERQAKRISDRVQATLEEMDLEKALLWDDNDNQEFYVVYNGNAVVWNYANNTWYTYSEFPAISMCNFQGELYYGTKAGTILRVTYSAEDDNGETITAEWVSGAMDFGAGYSRKYSSMMWVGLKPEEGTSVDVCVETDRKDNFREKIVSSEKAKVHGQPFMVKTKIKAKKFVYYRLLLKVEDRQPAVTVTNVDFRVRETGYAK